MSEEKGTQDYSAVVRESGAKKLGENIANRALDFVVDSAKKHFRRGKIKLGVAFNLYLDNAYNRINQVKTLATGNDPRNIIGENELYVQIGVKYKDEEIDTSYVENLTEVSNNILIIGTGGIGKSMLSKYLFLRAVLDGEYIPVYVELRKISQQSAGNVSIIKLIADCMEQFDIELPEDEFIYSLRLGKYLFLFDGFDEVKEELSLETADKIQQFCAKYPQNNYIMTSRKTDNCNPLETFVHMNSMPLKKDQAIELASKIWEKDEKTVEFCKQLDEELFDKHNSFAKNPLLLSMMFLTFMRNLSIPNHLSDFYKKAYEALYSQHDNCDKGIYRRDFKCYDLVEGQFKLLFARFCFQTYFQQKYEFEKKEILGFIKKCAVFLKYSIDEKDYLEDLKNAVCMIVEDGNIYKFSHRSFQAYFAAVYTSEKLTDEKQKQFFVKFLSDNYIYYYKDYFELLNQIESERFAINVLEDGLRNLQGELDESEDPDFYLLKQQIKNFDFTIDKKSQRLTTVTTRDSNQLYDVNLIKVLRTIIYEDEISGSVNDLFHKIDRIMHFTVQDNVKVDDNGKEICVRICFDELDKRNDVSVEDTRKMYDLLVDCYCGGSMLREKIREFLHNLDNERANLATDNYIDNL